MAGSRAKPWVVDDELWAIVGSLLPQTPKRFRYPGRSRLDARLVSQGILFVLHTGIGWEHLPQELGFGSGMTVCGGGTPGTWVATGASCTSCCWSGSSGQVRSTGRARSRTPPTCRRKRGGWLGPSPVDRGRVGAKHHVLPDARGLLLAWSLTGANRNDVTQLLALLDAIPAMQRTTGATPAAHAADRRPWHDHDKYRRLLGARGSRHSIARRQTEHGLGLGRDRWVVEPRSATCTTSIHYSSAPTPPDHPPRVTQPRSPPALLQLTPPPFC